MAGEMFVRATSDRDLPRVCAVLAEAFHDDPVLAFLLDEDSRGKGSRSRPSRRGALLAAFFANRILGGRGIDHILVAGDEAGVAAAAIWIPPRSFDEAGPDLTKMGIVNAIALGEAVMEQRRKALIPLFETSPTTPNWYLQFLGTLPSSRGRGLASALIAEVTARCDAEGIGAHLESSNPTNVPLYARHGFAVTAEVAIEGGPTVPVMWRDPDV